MTVKLSEADFMAQVTQLAELCGWQWVHFRTSMYGKHHMTAASGPLGKGWPDLVLVRGHAMIAVELKRDGGKATVEQEYVLSVLGDACELAEVWRPANWAYIEVALR